MVEHGLAGEAPIDKDVVIRRIARVHALPRVATAGVALLSQLKDAANLSCSLPFKLGQLGVPLAQAWDVGMVRATDVAMGSRKQLLREGRFLS